LGRVTFDYKGFDGSATAAQQSVKELHDVIISDHASVAGNQIYINPFVISQMETIRLNRRSANILLTLERKWRKCTCLK